MTGLALALLLAGTSPHVDHLSVSNGSRPFAGDNRLLTTVSPNGDGLRDRAIVRFRLDRRATVRLAVLRTDTLHPGRATRTIWSTTRHFGKGRHQIVWRPARRDGAADIRPPAPGRPPRVHEPAGRAPPGTGRPRPGARGRLPETQLCPGRARRPSDLGRHGVAEAPGLLLLEHGRAAGPRPQDGRDSDDGPDPRRLAGAPRRPGNAPLHPRGQLAERSLLRAAHGRGRPRRLCAVRGQEAGAAIPGRGRPLDEHLAGLQLLGRGRRRLGRQLVREQHDAKRRPGSPVSRLRRPVPLPRLGPRLHRLAEPDGETGRLPLGRRPRGVFGRPAGRRVRPRRLPRACRVRDEALLRRRPALPRPRRKPHVPRGEQLLLEGSAPRAAA